MSLNINIEETFKTPKVEYFGVDHKLAIEGKLIPEDPLLFFTELENWIDKFSDSDQVDLVIEFYLYYYNTSALKRMVFFLQKLDKLDKTKANVQILWKCDNGDEDNIEDGQDFKKSLNIGFDIVVVEEEEEVN